MTYSEWMEKLNRKSEEKNFPNDTVFHNTNDGTWIANKNGTKVLFHDSMQMLTTAWNVADSKWQKKNKSLADAVERIMTTMYLSADAKDIDIIYHGDSAKHYIHEAVKLTRTAFHDDDLISIDAYVDKSLVREFPKNAIYYTKSWCDPVLVCLPEDKKCRGRILPIAIVMPFNPKYYEIREEN